MFNHHETTVVSPVVTVRSPRAQAFRALDVEDVANRSLECAHRLITSNGTSLVSKLLCIRPSILLALAFLPSIETVSSLLTAGITIASLYSNGVVTSRKLHYLIHIWIVIRHVTVTIVTHTCATLFVVTIHGIVLVNVIEEELLTNTLPVFAIVAFFACRSAIALCCPRLCWIYILHAEISNHILSLFPF